jgi:hypothetical protein
MMRNLMILFVSMLFAACTAIPDSAGGRLYQEQAGDEPAAVENVEFDESQIKPVEETEEDVKEDRSIFVDILLYVPNRVLDALDIVRFGVSAGLGIGVDLTATEYLNVTLMTRASVGVGYQTLRHLPIEAASYAMVGAGPLQADAEVGFDWHRSPGDIRVELFVLVVGAHVCVEAFEIFDLAAGFLFFDPMEDDL